MLRIQLRMRNEVRSASEGTVPIGSASEALVKNKEVVMKRRNAWIQAAGTGTFLMALLLGVLQAEDGRDFAGSYELREITDLGETVSGRFVADVINYSGGDIVGATILLEGSMLSGDPYASWPHETILDREDVRVEAWITVPKPEYEQWRQGHHPTLQVAFDDPEGNSLRRPVELAHSLLGEED